MRKFKWDRKACWNCGRLGHFTGACHHTTYVDGSEMSDEEEEDTLDSSDNQYTYSVKEVDNRLTPGMTWHHIPLRDLSAVLALRRGTSTVFLPVFLDKLLRDSTIHYKFSYRSIITAALRRYKGVAL